MSDPPPKLAVILSSFNRLNLLQTALGSLTEVLPRLPWRSAVIIFDAGSTDGSIEWIETFSRTHPELPAHLLQPGLEGDRSFSAGVNRSCEFARAHYPAHEFVLLFETDNWVAGPAPIAGAKNLLEAEPSLAAVGFTVRNHKGQAVGYGCPFPTVSQFILGPQASCWLKLDRPRPAGKSRCGAFFWWPCDVVYTSPLLVRRSAWEASSGFDEKKFPFSDADVDWAWRLRKLGWKMAVLETDEIVHDNRAQLSGWSARRTLSFHRARMILLRRHRGSWAALARPFLAARHAAEMMLLALLPATARGKKESIKIRGELLRKAFRDYE